MLIIQLTYLEDERKREAQAPMDHHQSDSVRVHLCPYDVPILFDEHN
jgi:hypothetical protein